MTLKDLVGKRIAIYLRISSSHQDFLSQRESLQRFLDQHGLKAVRWYKDVGSRHHAYKRQEFLQMMTGVENGEYDVILVDAKDRFGCANHNEFCRFLGHLANNDTILWSVAGGNHSADDIGTELLNTIDSFRSRDEQTERSRRALKEKILAGQAGTFTGSVAPYGYDVACFGPDNQEKWRVRYDGGRHLRTKLYHDGRPSEPFNGEDNFPPKEKADVLRLVPSCDESRREWVVKVFTWYSQEAISINGIAKRLAALKVKPAASDYWYSGLIGRMLRNPIYVLGVPVWNRTAQGEFWEYSEGGYKKAPTKKGKGIIRKRDQADWLHPKLDEGNEPCGFVDRKTWDLVQAKLRGIKTPGRAPKNPDLWLGGTLFCGHCGSRLVGWSYPKNLSSPLSYLCQSYRRYGRKNPHGCKAYQVKHHVAEAVVTKYLEEAGQKLALITSSGHAETVLQALKDERWEKSKEYLATLEGMTNLVEALKGDHVLEIDGEEYELYDLKKSYREQHEQSRPAIEKAIADKTEEMRALVKSQARLKGTALKVALEDIDQLEDEIDKLQASLQPLDEKADDLLLQMRNLAEAFREARARLPEENNRRKAEAVRSVVSRVLCHFTTGTVRGRERIVLDRLVIEPAVGEPQEVKVDDFLNGLSPRPD